MKCDVCGYSNNADSWVKCPMDNGVCVYGENYPVEYGQQQKHALVEKYKRPVTMPVSPTYEQTFGATCMGCGKPAGLCQCPIVNWPLRGTKRGELKQQLIELRDTKANEDEQYAINTVLKAIQRVDALCPTCGK